MNLNQCQFAGRLTRDVELQYTPKGTAIASLSLAVNRRWTDASGAKQEAVVFVNLKAFAKTAETMGQYLSKGSLVWVSTRFEVEEWNDKATGDKRSNPVFTIEQFQFIGGKSDGESRPPQRQAAAAPAGDFDDDTDIPF